MTLDTFNAFTGSIVAVAMKAGDYVSIRSRRGTNGVYAWAEKFTVMDKDNGLVSTEIQGLLVEPR